MKIRNPRTALAIKIGIAALFMLGCKPPQQTVLTPEKANSDAAAKQYEIKQIAETALGQQAEILAHGDLARNGLEQLLVVNPIGKPPAGNIGSEGKARILITRAAILEKDNGKWTEVLRCDEHLKNQNGYLGGTPPGPVTGWSFEFSSENRSGLELQFSSADIFDTKNVHTGQWVELKNPIFVVRWNQSAKRYQSMDQSQERYLNEVPTLETPMSILK